MLERDTNRAVFYEVEEWEQEYLADHPPVGDAIYVSAPLTLENADLARDADVVSVFIRSRVTEEVMEELPDLRLLVTRSTGYDHIDVEAARRRGVLVCNVPYYGEQTVAEHTFGLILALSRKLKQAYLRTVQGNFSVEGLRGFDLKGKTLGVIGAGNIGLHVIRIARGFGMEVLAYDVRQNHMVAEVLGFTYVDLPELLARSHVVSLHVPYIPATHHLINRQRLGWMRRGALLINTARGAIVDTDALIWALDEGILGGAGLDVIEGEELIRQEEELLREPVAEDKLRAVLRQHVLVRRENVVITPHIAFNSVEALERIMETTLANIRAYREGKPQHVVNA